jgi:cytochrome c oxidase subunit 4
MAHDAAPNAGYDWEDPHHFHRGEDAQADHDHDGHHVTPWQLLFAILFILLALTALTVFSAQAESWLIGLGVHISHFWNVIIAMSIALVKATLVCMYFMHLKHDNPLNTMILLTTLFVFGLFLLFTGIDIYERDAINEFKSGYIVEGGTGANVAPGGGSFSQTITNDVKQRRIDKYAAQIAKENGHTDENGEPAPTEDDIAAAQKKFWFDFYHHKFEDHPEHLPEAHAFDTAGMHAKWVAHHIETHGDHHVSTANETVARHGRTPGLFSADAHGDHGSHDTHDDHDDHADPHADPHAGDPHAGDPSDH